MRKLSLLIAAPDPAFAEEVADLLLSAGLSADIRQVPDLSGLRAALAEADCDAILSDHRLRDGTGLEALAEARRARPRTPFLYLAGACGEEAVAEAFRLGAADFVSKAGLAALPGRLRRALASRDPEAEAGPAAALGAWEREAGRVMRAGIERFRMLSEASIEAIAVMTQGRVESANRAMAEMFGYREEELRGRDIAEFIAPESREEVLARGASGQYSRYEAIGLRKNGTRFPIEIRGMSPEGGGVRVKGILDLSRQKRVEEELDSFFRLSLDMFCILGFDGLFRRANPAWERTLGYAVESLVGSFSLDLVHPDDREATSAQARLLAEGRDMAAFENRYRHKDGTWRWLLWSASARPAEGVIYAVARDVTDRKRSEEENRRARDLAEETSRAKGRFLANMSHEIRTPMNGVVSMAGLLAETTLDHRQSGYVKIIQTSARNLLRVINDILDFSKLEQGRLGLENRTFDLRELIGDVAEMFASDAGAKGIRLDWSFAPGTPRQVKADPGRLRQVLVNLVGNALKFTDEGRVEIRARCLTTAEAGLELRFEVEDTGPGIGPEAGKRLFEPFSQLDPSDTRRHGGTGLGLAISRQLAELMGGEIGFDSVPGRGACFWFTIRAELPEPGRPEGEAEPAAAWQAVPQARGDAARPLRILVAEDNPINQMVAVCLLERLGHRPEIVANGREALEACKAIEYDVIFMDCQMPELDGYAATARIRRLERKGRRRPYIVAMTADALPGSRERCLQAGMDAHLTKPVLIEDLQAALAQAHGAAPALPKAAPAGKEEDAIDLRIVERLRDASGEDAEGMFGNLVEGFLAEAREKRAGLEGLAAAGRGDELSKAAHALKGLSLNFGCRGMARVCDGIQRAARAGNLGEAASLAASLADETARAGERLRGLIAPAPAGSRAGREGAHG